MIDDPYADPASGVLRNPLGITDPDQLVAAEGDITAAAIAELAESPEPGAFDLAHLSRIHRRIFGEIYEWAGEVRTVGIDKGLPFALPGHIATSATTVFGDLADEDYLFGLPRGRFVARLAHYFGEVNALHPLREGNGRAQRAFFRQLVAEAGWHIDWTPGEPRGEHRGQPQEFGGRRRAARAVV